MLAGQGSQYFSMGRELYERNPSFRYWLDLCSRRLQPALQLSLAEYLYRERADRFAPFEQTRLTHPAVFCLNYCMAQALIEEGIRPDALLGYSLGELVAWTLAGTIPLEEALDAVAGMAVCFEDRTPPAGMLAVLAPVSLIDSNPGPFRNTTLACVNYSAHFVVTGALQDLLVAEQAVKQMNIPCQMLPITRGFHSGIIDPVESHFTGLVLRLKLRPPSIPVFSSMLARQASFSDLTPRHFWEVVRGPVRFWDTVRHMESQGPARYVDAGPSGTLASFVRQILGSGSVSSALPILSPFGKDVQRLEKLRSDLGRA